MTTHTKLMLLKFDNPDTLHNDWARYTHPSNFVNTQTSMYTAVIGLQSSTGYGGASLGNQSERYLLAVAGTGTEQDSNISSAYRAELNSGTGTSFSSWLADFLAHASGYGFTPDPYFNNFNALQDDLEDDGQYLGHISLTDDNYTYILIDKNTLGSTIDGSASGSSAAADTSILSWAYSSQSATDPSILIDWVTTPNFTITEDTTDWKQDIKNKITASSLSITTLIEDYLLEDSISPNLRSFKDYVTYKLG